MSAYDKIARLNKLMDEFKSRLEEKEKDLEIVATIGSAATRDAASLEIDSQVECLKDSFIKYLSNVK